MTVPWNAIGLAILLFLAGGGLLAVGILIKIGQITSEVKVINKAKLYSLSTHL